MTLEIGILFALLVVMVFLFLTEKLPVDLTAFSGLVILVFMGYVTPDEAFTGFASSAVITMLSIFIVGASLLHTGIADIVGGWIHEWVGSREIHLIVVIMLVSALLSAFMNNIAATAVLMPAVASLAKRAQIPPSRLFMSLSFSAILGGTTTLIGTPPNILAAEMLSKAGLEPFELFDYTPIGLILVVVGILFMATIGRKLLPDRVIRSEGLDDTDLAHVYSLHERMFTFQIPKDSGLAGKTIAESKLASQLGIRVVGITREQKRRLAPDPGTVLKSGDVLLVKGRLEEFREILRVQGVRVEKTSRDELPPVIPGTTGVSARISAESELVGKSLKEVRFREKYGFVVIGIVRGEEVRRSQLVRETLAKGDVILGLGPEKKIESLKEHADFEDVEVGFVTLGLLGSHLYMLRIPEGSPLDRSTIAESKMGERFGLTIAGIVRGDETLLAVSSRERILAGDKLLIIGEPSKVIQMLELGEVQLESSVSEPELESEEIGVAEATVAPRSLLAGKTPKDLAFRDRYGLQILAIWREGRLIRTGIASRRLKFGDALLLHGPRKKLHQLGADPDFVLLGEGKKAVRRISKAPFAFAGLLLMIGLVVTGFQPIHVAAFTAATFIILTGAITMEESYRAIEWRVIFLVAAIMPVSFAMERTGAAQMLAEGVSELAGPLGPYVVLASLVTLSSLLSQGLDGAPAVVLLAPVVTQAAVQLGISPYPLMMGVGIAASAAFMTPFSHKANLLVMGAGDYRSMDYVKVGTPLTVVLIILMVLTVPVFFPF